MSDGNEHDECVDAWLRRAPEDLTLEQQLRRFERAFGAVLARAHQTLGEVTLMAVLDRVLYVAAEKYPLLSELEAEATRVSCQKLLRVAHAVPPAQHVAAIRFVMVEFLSVLGKLTAEILTPALHGELTRDLETNGSSRLERSAEAGSARAQRVDATSDDTRSGPTASHAHEGPEEAES
jgi:hypothetical protein